MAFSEDGKREAMKAVGKITALTLITSLFLGSAWENRKNHEDWARDHTPVKPVGCVQDKDGVNRWHGPGLPPQVIPSLCP